MFRAALVFFILGLVGMFLGLYGVAGLSIEIGKIILIFFILVSVLSLIGGMINNKKIGSP